MFCSDKPIEKKENDRLNRRTFSKELAQAILSYTEKDNFTIGLYGKWGCGKTSIINMAVEEIKETTKDNPPEQKPIIISFNPWNYSDCSQLIGQFFQTLKTTLEGEDIGEKLRKVSESLDKYAAILEYSSCLPVIGKYLNPIKKVIMAIKVITSKKDKNTSSLKEQKNEIVKTLREQEQKIIIIIDDIDRLNNDQIRLIFQLVNSVADFPNMIYLLSFDFEVVVRALEEVQRCDGKEYLEKIVQVPFNVPESKKSLIENVFFNKLIEIWFDATPCKNFEKDYWLEVYRCCISPFIQNIRDINRIINVYRFKYGLMRDETNCVDLLALTTIQICAPVVYNWISNNINDLTGAVHNEGISLVDQQKNRAAEMDKFANIYDKPTEMLKILQALFPKFSHKTGGNNSFYEKREDLRKHQRIAHPDKSERYFYLSLEDIQFTNQQIKDVITKYDEITIQKLCERSMRERTFSTLLQELEVYIDDIPKNRLELFFDIMVKQQTDERNYEQRTFLSLSPAYLCIAICRKILNRFPSADALKLLVFKIQHSDIHTFSILVKIVLYIERSYGRIGNGISSDHLQITEQQLDFIEKITLEQIRFFSENSELLDTFDFASVCQMWKYLDENSMDTYIKEKISDTSNLIKYLYFCSSTWSSSTGETGWSFEEKSFSQYISVDDAHTKISSLQGTKMFLNLKRKHQEIAVAYYLWYNSDPINRHDISQTAVDKLIPEWETQEKTEIPRNHSSS